MMSLKCLFLGLHCALALVALAEPDHAVYFTTWEGGIQAYSTLKSEVKTIVNGSESCYGIAYDTFFNKMYWSSYDEYKIYRASIDGSQVEAVLKTTQYGHFESLAFDWIGGNVYVGTADGHILACDAGRRRSFSCVEVLSGQGKVSGIALDPIQRIMYWTGELKSGGSIWRASMDGSNPFQIVTELNSPTGITIDFNMSKLYWTDFWTTKIQSSNFDGSDVRTVVKVPDSPFGVAAVDDKLYWGTFRTNLLQSSTKKGGDMHTPHNNLKGIRHLAALRNFNLV